ncbi:MAG: SDR family oxidoreductase [Thermaceae bacterium]|nr:SDR family oxidoreductase [Thermaceae bacterium]
MNGKTVLITGATNGIGKATATELAGLGATVVITGRDRARGHAVLEEIRSKTGNSKLDLLVADLSSQAEVRRLAAEFKAKYPRLNVLINNAGGFFDTRQTNVDGLEYTFAFNHLAYFLLTNLLLDTLKVSAPSRIVNVSSAAQSSGRLNFDDLQAEKRYSGMAAYNNSKLANVLFTYELARRLQGSGVTVNALHPGVVNTGFGDNSQNALIRGLLWLFKRFSLSPERGAETSVYLASSPQVEGVTGKYFDNKQAKSSNPLSYNEAEQKRLWDISAALTGLSEAKVAGN